jgi:hypothetical protein
MRRSLSEHALLKKSASGTKVLSKVLTVCLLLGLGMACGCGEKPKAKKQAGGDAGETQAAPAAAKEKEKEPAGPLPAIDPLTKMTLDGGRIEVFSPQGWFRAPRSSSYLVRYTTGPQKTHPAVTVLAGDPPGGFTAVTADNHGDFVAAVAAGLDAGSILKKPAALDAGPHLAATWVSKGEAKVSGLTQPVERSHVAVVVGGRMYTIEAEAAKGRVDAASRAAARAVAAALAVPAPAEPEPAAAEPAAEEKVEEAQAEPAPAEPEPAAAE